MKISFGNLSLVDDEASAAPAASATRAEPMAASPASTLSLEGDDGSMAGVSPFAAASEPVPAAVEPAPAPVAARRGALFVIAGLGGPDGVRQLLAALPTEVAGIAIVD